MESVGQSHHHAGVWCTPVPWRHACVMDMELTHLAGKMARRKSWRIPSARPTMLGPATSMSFTPIRPYSVCLVVGGICVSFNVTSVC